MAKQTMLFVKSFPCTATIANANVCLVVDTSKAGTVKLPGAARANQFVGVAIEPSDSRQAEPAVAVQIAGIAQIRSDGTGAIAFGDVLEIGDVKGQVRLVANASSGVPVLDATIANDAPRQIIGMALNAAAATEGLLVDVLLMPHYLTAK